MGRAFEFRKARKFKRWDKMSKAFTKIGKEISIAVKQGGSDPKNNTRLKVAIQNAKGVNMPKDRIDSAIKKATSKEMGDYQEIVYEGYGPHGVPIMVECATENPNRTVANLRMYFSRSKGELGVSGSIGFMFERKSIFRLVAENINIEELEFELIDFGLENIEADENELVIQTSFQDFGKMQKALEEKNINIVSSEVQRLPNVSKDLDEEQANDLTDLLDKLEEDDDVQQVFHNVN